jgi:hypothetical protein
MQEFTLPKDTANYQLRVELDGVMFLLDFRWNARQATWKLSVSNEDGDLLVSGIAVISNRALLARYRTLPGMPRGELFAADFTGTIDVPDYTQLGEEVSLLYFTYAEVLEGVGEVVPTTETEIDLNTIGPNVQVIQGPPGPRGSTGPAGAGGGCGLFASKPPAGNAGVLYIATDSPTALWADDGTTWRPLIAGQVMGTQPPTASSWAEFNASDQTLVDVPGGLLLTGKNDLTSLQMRGFQISYSNTITSMALEMGCTRTNDSSIASSTYSGTGIELRNSATGRGYYLGFFTDHYLGKDYLECGQMSSDNTRTSNYVLATQYNLDAGGPVFCRILVDSASTIYSQFSRNLLEWTQVHSIAYSTVFVSGDEYKPDQVCLTQVGYGVLPRAYINHFKYGPP